MTTMFKICMVIEVIIIITTILSFIMSLLYKDEKMKKQCIKVMTIAIIVFLLHIIIMSIIYGYNSNTI